jgi:hypothetical protein
VLSYYDMDPGPDCPELVRMIVEIPKNSTNKYEYDGKLGIFRLDRSWTAGCAISTSNVKPWPRRQPFLQSKTASYAAPICFNSVPVST